MDRVAFVQGLRVAPIRNRAAADADGPSRDPGRRLRISVPLPHRGISAVRRQTSGSPPSRQHRRPAQVALFSLTNALSCCRGRRMRRRRPRRQNECQQQRRCLSHRDVSHREVAASQDTAALAALASTNRFDLEEWRTRPAAVRYSPFRRRHLQTTVSCRLRYLPMRRQPNPGSFWRRFSKSCRSVCTARVYC